MHDENEVEIIASRFHGGLAAVHGLLVLHGLGVISLGDRWHQRLRGASKFGHGVGLWFNIRSHNHADAAIHGAGILYADRNVWSNLAYLLYDAGSAIKHHCHADESLGD